MMQAKVFILEERCKGCGNCVQFCPVGVLGISEKVNRKGYHVPEILNDECSGCGMCEMMCPDFAIWSEKE